jgi:capsular exopolysaccharide synthesis family protein
VTFSSLIETLWQRRMLFLATSIACMAAIVAVTLALPEKYDATATLFVGERQNAGDALAFDTNIGEQLARTYTTLAAQPSVADEVRAKLPSRPTREQLLENMTFAPVERTQLLQLTARATSPKAAADLANLYAETFVTRVSGNFERGGAPTRVSVAEPAVAPSVAALPNMPLNLAVGLLLALALGTAAALLVERLDDRLRIQADDREVLDHPVLGRIPAFRVRDFNTPAVSDSFRLLRTNIDFSTQPPPAVIAVTSSSPLEGKSTTAAQTALAAAHDGERVVLVEADLRRPGLRHTAVGLDVEMPSIGLTNHLAGTERLADILSEHPAHPGLSVIWPGPLPPNPSRLLGSERFVELIAELRRTFDRVIVDTSPISVGPDASLVMTRVDGAIFVVDSQRTSRSRSRSGVAQLEASRVPILGIVVNRAGRPSRDAYGYYAAAPESGPRSAADGAHAAGAAGPKIGRGATR